MLHLGQPLRLQALSTRLAFQTARSTQAYTAIIQTPSQRLWASQTCQKKKGCPSTQPASMTSKLFWSSGPTWKRASVNTTRCLIGCTLGDFSAMWFLQMYYSDLGMAPIMAISSKIFSRFITRLWLITLHSGQWHLKLHHPRDYLASPRP